MDPSIYPISQNGQKQSNNLSALRVFDHFVGLALKGLRIFRFAQALFSVLFAQAQVFRFAQFIFFKLNRILTKINISCAKSSHQSARPTHPLAPV